MQHSLLPFRSLFLISIADSAVCSPKGAWIAFGFHTSMPGTAARDEYLTDTHRHAQDKWVSFNLMVTLKLR